MSCSTEGTDFIFLLAISVLVEATLIVSYGLSTKLSSNPVIIIINFDLCDPTLHDLLLLEWCMATDKQIWWSRPLVQISDRSTQVAMWPDHCLESLDKIWRDKVEYRQNSD